MTSNFLKRDNIGDLRLSRKKSDIKLKERIRRLSVKNFDHDFHRK